MLGHKRGGCQSPTKDASPKSDARRKSLSPLDFKMKALDIASPEKEERERAQRRRSSAAHAPRPETLVSLSSNDKAALSILAKPGMMSEKFPKDEKAELQGNITKWLYSVPPPACPRKSRRSQGPSDAELALNAKQELQDTMISDDARSSTPRPKEPLHRTYSSKDMDDFLASLEEKSTQPKTQIYRIPAADVDELKKRAARCNLYARGAVPEKGDGWVVVGADRAAVEDVCNRVATEEKRQEGGLRGVLGSGFVGAAITWLALAYA